MTCKGYQDIAVGDHILYEGNLFLVTSKETGIKRVKFVTGKNPKTYMQTDCWIDELRNNFFTVCDSEEVALLKLSS